MLTVPYKIFSIVCFFLFPGQTYIKKIISEMESSFHHFSWS